jgi:hypothetical protein
MLREAYRICPAPQNGYRIILYANKETRDASPLDIASSLKSGYAKLGIVRDV